MSEKKKTPQELAKAVGNWLPSEFQVQHGNRVSLDLAHKSLAELQELAIEGTTKAPLEERVARLEASVLPPAESCAEAVSRFRDALELLAKRHQVEVEVGGIDPGSCCAGISDLPDAAEIDADYRKEFETAERERIAWDQIEAWIDRAESGSVRSAEFRKPKQRHDEFKYSIILDQRESSVRMCDGVRSSQGQSKPVRALSRVGALEVAAAWCKEQK